VLKTIASSTKTTKTSNLKINAEERGRKHKVGSDIKSTRQGK